MEELILISYLNDFIFCPVSIYFHKLYGNMEKTLYQDIPQIMGSKAHEAVDKKTYSSKKGIFQGVEVYTEKYNILGKIDIYDFEKKVLTERKKKINTIYSGYIFQLYAQYFALTEMGFEVKKMRLYSMDDNKIYDVLLPEENNEMFLNFEKLINDMNNFDIRNFNQTNKEKCRNCIYEPACDRSLLC